MTPLKPPDSFHLQAAQGWLGLGNWREASEELEQITPTLRAHPDVLRVRHDTYAAAKQWELAAEVARALSELVPDDCFGIVHLAYALHELGRTKEAFDCLLPVADKFTDVWTIPYNLSCYCAQLGRLEESMEWFKRAMALNEDPVKRSAIDDPDLKPLWDSMAGTLWKRA